MFGFGQSSTSEKALICVTSFMYDPFLPGGPWKFIGKVGEGRSSDLNGLLLSIRTGLRDSSMSLCTFDPPPFLKFGVKLEAESGLSGVGLE